jgi:hypothetical protein
MTNGQWKLLACTIVVVSAAIALWPAFYSPAMPMDEGMVLVYPEMLLKGYLPYRDFESIYGPGNVSILAAAYAGFGANIFVERAVGLICRLLILVGIFGIIQRWDTIIATGCMFVTGVLLAGTDLSASNWIAGIAFALCSFWMMANINSGWRCFSAGMLASASLLCRCDFGPVLVVSSLPLFLLMKRSAKISFISGGVLAMLPLLWLTIVAGPAQIFHSLFLFPVFKLSAGRHLPISSAKAGTLYLFCLQLSAGVLNIVAGIVALRDEVNRPRGRLLLAVALFGLGLVPYALQRFDAGHVLNAAFVSLSLFPLSIFVLLSAATRKIPASVISAVAILIVIAGTHLLLSSFTRYFYRGLRVQLGISAARQALKAGDDLQPGDKAIFIKHNGRSFPFGFRYAADDTDNVLTELERVSLPGQRLFVGPGDLRLTNYCDTYIYYMEPQLRPSTYFLEMNPGSANAPRSRLARDVESADWLVLNRRWDILNEPNRSTDLGPAEPNQVVRQEFDFWSEYGSLLLFRNKKLRNAIVPLPP